MREIDRLPDFDDWVANDTGPAAVQSLDLRDRTAALCGLDRRGSLFLACRMDERAAGHLVISGAVIVPDLGKAFTVHRADLYAPEDLYSGYDPDRPATFAETLDQRIYREYLADSALRPDLETGFAGAAHDHSISDALDSLLEGQRVVAIMGGHGLKRSSARYAQVVRIAKALAERSYLLASGGGPGAMEATHLGAWLAGRPDHVIDDVLASPFVQRPPGAPVGREYADPDWLARAWRVRERWPHIGDVISVGVPTWLYGHEPPTPFATHLAKYFANSVREDGVLAIANHGVIFAEGSAGTTQEIFQDACQNHYGTVGTRSPMVLLGVDHWTRVRPVWPLLLEASRGEVYGELVTLADEDAEVLRAIQRFQPSWYVVTREPDLQFEADLRRVLRLRDNWVRDRTSHPSVQALGPTTPAGWEDVLDWLHAIGDDDWIDRERGARLLPALCAPHRLVRTAEGIARIDGPLVTAWSARLND